jgi:hypothetical protein
MGLRRSWFSDVRRRLGLPDPGAAVAQEAERVVALAAARERLTAVEGEIAVLLADEQVPARARRLRALGQARDDLRAQLGEGPDVPTVAGRPI